MACMPQSAPAMAMTATQFARMARSEKRRQLDRASERAPLRMKWVAVTDSGKIGNSKCAGHPQLPTTNGFLSSRQRSVTIL
jgi:hypothetical protein